HAVIHGRVQGVFFRETTCQQAKRLGLSGWVRNLDNGTVETEFEGGQETVKSMLAWLAQGSTLSRVDRVESQERDPVYKESEFTITW
ncbi:MAG: acylphosphatase, partial [Proteobacteria bacterium]|nr:acylphosphatase [Pseudomonadota bacterium]